MELARAYPSQRIRNPVVTPNTTPGAVGLRSARGAISDNREPIDRPVQWTQWDQTVHTIVFILTRANDRRAYVDLAWADRGRGTAPHTLGVHCGPCELRLTLAHRS